MKKLIQRQMQKKIESLKSFREKVSGVPSWIRYMRKALNMTPGQLAKRMNLTLPSLYQLERQEASDKINIQSLKKAAKAMECDLVYAFVPRKPLSEMIDHQAKKRAKNLSYPLICKWSMKIRPFPKKSWRIKSMNWPEL